MTDLVILKQKHNSYAAGFKVISFVGESYNCAISCHFRINDKLICDWRKNKAKVENMPKSKKASWHGKIALSKTLKCIT